MLQFNTSIRVRYGETDKMGYVYYGNYAQYFEVARVELLRSLGVSYKGLEDSGIMLPVLHFDIKYIKPAFYDDLLTIKTIVEEVPKIKIKFKYETYNQENVLLNIAETTLVFVDMETNKPTKCPEKLLNTFEANISD